MFCIISPNFLAFHIPLIFALQQYIISEICTLSQPIKLLIFRILMIRTNIENNFNEDLKIYFGLAETAFKERFQNHTKDFYQREDLNDTQTYPNIYGR